MWRKAVCALAPRGARLTRRLADGTIVGGPNRDGYGGRGAFVFGDAIEPEFTILRELVGSGGVIVDVGANTGIYTLKGSRIVGAQGVVVALEPNPAMLAELARNVDANKYENVRLRGLGASDAAGEFSFWRNHGKPNSFSLVRRDDCPDRFSILTIDLDTLLRWEGLDRVDLLKVDAEGVEDLVLAGAAQTVKRHRPVIIAEVDRGGLSRLPDGYQAWAPQGVVAGNRVLLPNDHACEAPLSRQGWVTTRL